MCFLALSLTTSTKVVSVRDLLTWAKPFRLLSKKPFQGENRPSFFRIEGASQCNWNAMPAHGHPVAKIAM
jgi:hypothetical protein